jgi:hypothetical protein
MVQGTQPFRKVPPRGRLYEPRAWPCGHHDGGFMFGGGDECRAADILLEDYVGPPLYTGRPRSRMTVESTHQGTVMYATLEDGLKATFFNIPHEWGLGGPPASLRSEAAE